MDRTIELGTYFNAIFQIIATAGACTIAVRQGKTLAIDTKGLTSFIVHLINLTDNNPLQNLSGSNNLSSSAPPTGHRRQSRPLAHVPPLSAAKVRYSRFVQKVSLHYRAIKIPCISRTFI